MTYTAKDSGGGGSGARHANGGHAHPGDRRTAPASSNGGPRVGPRAAHQQANLKVSAGTLAAYKRSKQREADKKAKEVVGASRATPASFPSAQHVGHVGAVSRSTAQFQSPVVRPHTTLGGAGPGGAQGAARGPGAGVAYYGTSGGGAAPATLWAAGTQMVQNASSYIQGVVHGGGYQDMRISTIQVRAARRLRAVAIGLLATTCGAGPEGSP